MSDGCPQLSLERYLGSMSLADRLEIEDESAGKLLRLVEDCLKEEGCLITETTRLTREVERLSIMVEDLKEETTSLENTIFALEDHEEELREELRAEIGDSSEPEEAGFATLHRSEKQKWRHLTGRPYKGRIELCQSH